MATITQNLTKIAIKRRQCVVTKVVTRNDCFELLKT